MSESGVWTAQSISDKTITFEEYNEKGCPVCKTGEKRCSTPVKTPTEALAICANCYVGYIVLFR